MKVVCLVPFLLAALAGCGGGGGGGGLASSATNATGSLVLPSQVNPVTAN